MEPKIYKVDLLSERVVVPRMSDEGYTEDVIYFSKGIIIDSELVGQDLEDWIQHHVRKQPGSPTKVFYKELYQGPEYLMLELAFYYGENSEPTIKPFY